LAISAFSCPDTGLIDILQRHSSTLKHLELSHAMLTKGSWKAVLPQMRSVLPLHCALFRGCFGNTNDEEHFDVATESEQTDYQTGSAFVKAEDVASYLLKKFPQQECPFQDLDEDGG
jgi:hypothetical protein